MKFLCADKEFPWNDEPENMMTLTFPVMLIKSQRSCGLIVWLISIQTHRHFNSLLFSFIFRADDRRVSDQRNSQLIKLISICLAGRKTGVMMHDRWWSYRVCDRWESLRNPEEMLNLEVKCHAKVKILFSAQFSQTGCDSFWSLTWPVLLLLDHPFSPSPFSRLNSRRAKLALKTFPNVNN